MKRYLIDVPTLTSLWVTARTEDEAKRALDDIPDYLEVRYLIGGEHSIELVDFTIQDEPEIIESYVVD